MLRKKVKLKPCKQCGNMFKPMNTLQPVCSPACALKFNSEKEVKKRVKEMKSNVTKLSTLEAIAKKAFQAWVRKRDEFDYCISCGKNQASQWDGSHFFKAEMFSGVIFHDMNVNKACSYCNQFLDGNLINYRKGLIKKHGEEKVLELEELANRTRNYKWTKEELIEITKTYKEKLKQLNVTQHGKYNVGKPIDVVK